MQVTKWISAAVVATGFALSPQVADAQSCDLNWSTSCMVDAVYIWGSSFGPPDYGPYNPYAGAAAWVVAGESA